MALRLIWLHMHIWAKRGQRGVCVIITSSDFWQSSILCTCQLFVTSPPSLDGLSKLVVSVRYLSFLARRTLTWHQQLTGAVDQIVHNWLECVECQRFQFVGLHIDGQQGGGSPQQTVVDLLQQIVAQIQGFQCIQTVQSALGNSLENGVKKISS